MKNEEDLCHIYDPSLFNVNDFNVLLHEILKQTREILNSEAGSIYINEGECLSFNVFQNDAMSYENIYRQFYALRDVKLPLTQYEKYLAVKSFVSNKIIIIDDVYNADEFDFMGVKEFDKRFDYRTKSIITAPIIHPIDNKKLGVIQLLNKSCDGESVSFDEKDKKMLSMASSFIAISILKAQDDINKLKDLNKQLEVANEELQRKIELEVKESQRKSSIIYHQAKLASMGEMIGNIAHQWRQPLSAISTVASGLSFNIEIGNYEEDEALELLDKIVETTKHLSQTIDDFREFYNIDKVKKHFNLSKNILNSITITEASLSENHIETVLDLDENVFVYGYENELKQAILNMIQNSKEALLENIACTDDRAIFISLQKDENDAIITIKDNAGGIPSAILEQIFNQSFTTKEDNGGTGIGLYMTDQIIVKHMNGHISVENEEFEYKGKTHKGSAFTIRLKLSNNKSL